MIPEYIKHNGVTKKILKHEASWSLKLDMYPHLLWLLFEGDKKYTKFTSDNKGEFVGLEIE